MTTQYTSILKLALPVQGELSGTWGDVVNDNITSMVEQAIAGRAVVNTWSGNSHTLTTANGTTAESRCAMLEFTDTGSSLSAAGTVVCPALSKIYIAKNASGENVTLKTSSGSGILVPNGRTMFLFCDGTNVVEAVTSTTSLQLGTSTTVTAVLDEDNMASNSATSLATQQSIKAYVDAQVGSFDTLAEVLANGNTSGGTNIELSTTDKVQFRDAAIYINSSADGQLDIVADTEVQIAATTIDINGAINASGEIIAASLDISGDIDVDGTTNLDVVDIDGAVDMASTLEVDGNVQARRARSNTAGEVALSLQPSDSAIHYGFRIDSATNSFNLDRVDSAGQLLRIDTSGAATFNSSVTATSLDISGDIDVDGTTNLDATNIVGALTVDGAVQINSGSSGQITLDATDQYNQFVFEQSGVDNSGGDLLFDHTNEIFALRTLAVADIELKTSPIIGQSKTRLLAAANGDISFYEDTGTTAKLFWDASAESLGIGDSSPTNGNLTIRGASTTGTKNGHIMLTGDSATVGQGPQIAFSESGVNSNWVGAAIGFTRTGGSGVGDLLFSTRQSAGDANTTATEVMRLTSTGATTFSSSVTSAGLVVSNASGATLNVNTAGAGEDSKILLHETATATSEYGASLKYSGANNRFEIGTGQDPETKRLSIDRDTGDISFYEDTGTTAKLVWDASAESLGIGTDPNNAKLEVAAASGEVLRADAASGAYRLVVNQTGVNMNGIVGIGVTPEAWNTYNTLQIGNGAIVNYSPTHDMRMVSNAYYDSGWKYAESDGACNYLQDANNSAHRWEVAASGTADAAITWSQAMTLDASGNLLVGNTVANPASGYASQKGFGYEASTGKTEIATTADAPAMQIGKNHANAGDIVVLRKQANTIGSIGVGNSDDLYIGTADTGLVFQDNERISPWNPSTNALRDAAIDFGDSDRRFKDLYLSGGVIAGSATDFNVGTASNFSVSNGDVHITLERTTGSAGWGGIGANDANAFHVYNESTQKVLQVNQTDGSIQFPQSTSGGIYLGGTAAANKISDYETGSWTPVLRGTGTAGTPSVGTVYGSYVKVGKLVTLTFHISNMTLSGALGAIQITGIPFTAKTASNNYGNAAFSMTSNINFDGDKNQNWYMGSSYMLGLESQGGGGWADLAVTNASAIYINQTITYEEA